MRTATLVALLLCAPAPLAAQAPIRGLDGFAEGESPVDRLRAQLAEELRREGVVRPAVVEALMAGPDRVFLVDDFCDGCQFAHFWVLNLGAEPTWRIVTQVSVRHVEGIETARFDVNIPVMPPRSAARLSFEVPWPMQRTVTVQLGQVAPPADVVTVTFDDMVVGRPLDAALVAELAGWEMRYTLFEGERHEYRDAIDYALDHVTGEPLGEFARLLAAREGGAARVVSSAVRHLGDERGPVLVGALSDEGLDALVLEVRDGGHRLGALLAGADEALYARLAPRVAAHALTVGDAFVHGAMRTDEPARFAAMSAQVPAGRHRDAVGWGWRYLRDGDPLIAERLAWMRGLEDDEARALAVRVIERRHALRGWRIPEAARADVERLRRAAPAESAAIYRRALRTGQPFDVDDLVAARIDLVEFHDELRLRLHGCGRPGRGADLERCVESIRSQDALSAIATERGLRADWLEAATAILLEETSPEAARIGALLVPFGLDTGPLVAAFCARANVPVAELRATQLEAARALRADAACVVEADAEILGLAPSTVAIVAGVVAVALLCFGLLAVVFRRRHAAQQEAIRRALED